MKTIGDVEKQFGVDFGVRSDMKLSTYLKREGLPSMAKAVKLLYKERDKGYAFDRLAEAIGEWVEINGGKAVVVGGISIAQFPDDKLKYEIRIQVMGRKPIGKDL